MNVYERHEWSKVERKIRFRGSEEIAFLMYPVLG